MGYAKWFLNQRYRRLVDWIKGEKPDDCHDRWTNASMLWAYNLGLKHAKKKPKILIKPKGGK